MFQLHLQNHGSKSMVGLQGPSTLIHSFLTLCNATPNLLIHGWLHVHVVTWVVTRDAKLFFLGFCKITICHWQHERQGSS